MILFVFVVFGFVAVISQTLILREMLVVFGGNELSIGFVLAEWLLGSAAGSYLSGATGTRKILSPRIAISITLLLTAVLLVWFFPAISNIRDLLRVLPGQAIGLSRLFVTSCCVTFPLSFLIGSQFSFGAHWAQQHSADTFSWKVYFCESAGFMFGGIVLTFALLKLFSSVSIILTLSAICLLFSVMIFFRSRALRIGSAILVIVVCALEVPSMAHLIQDYSNGKLFSGYTVSEIRDTPYSQLAVLEKEDEKYLMSDGTTLAVFPDYDIENAEEFCYLPRLFRQATSRVLVLGGSGRFAEVLSRMGIDTVEYVEMDPELMRIVHSNFLTEFARRNVNISLTDAGSFVRHASARYDIVYVGFSYPATIATNRFYTVEFFKRLRRLLSQGGIVSVSVPGSAVYLGDDTAGLSAVLIETLTKVFSHVRVIPDAQTLILASDTPFEKDVDKLLGRFKEMPLSTKSLSAQLIRYKTDQGKEAWFLAQMKQFRARNSARWNTVKFLNRDWMPRAVRNSLVYFYSLAEPATGTMLRLAFRYAWVAWLLIGAWFFSGRVGVLGTSFSSGLAGMGLQIVSVMALQVTAGNIYSLIGISNAAFMAGLAGGSLLYAPYGRFFKVRDIEVSMAGWAALWLVLFLLGCISTPLTFLLSLGTGTLVGFEFPALTSARGRMSGAAESTSIGKVYALDLFGGCLGALAIGTAMLPSFGMFGTMFFILATKLISSHWWLRARH